MVKANQTYDNHGSPSKSYSRPKRHFASNNPILQDSQLGRPKLVKYYDFSNPSHQYIRELCHLFKYYIIRLFADVVEIEDNTLQQIVDLAIDRANEFSQKPYCRNMPIAQFSKVVCCFQFSCMMEEYLANRKVDPQHYQHYAEMKEVFDLSFRPLNYKRLSDFDLFI